MLTLNKSPRQSEKPIFSSPYYLESSVAYCDLCFALIDVRKDVYFLCETCDNFAACVACVKHTKHQLISHPTDHIFHPSKPLSNTSWLNRNLMITCDLCGQMNFIGKRYQCRQCCHFNVCSSCLSKTEDIHYPFEKHIFDLIPNPTKIHSNRYLLAERTKQVLGYRRANSSDRDETTGWMMNEAEIISKEELKNYIAVWTKALEIFKDEDINSKPNIIENEKSTVYLITVGNN